MSERIRAMVGEENQRAQRPSLATLLADGNDNINENRDDDDDGNNGAAGAANANAGG
jgi:hypothetical protein